MARCLGYLWIYTTSYRRLKSQRIVISLDIRESGRESWNFCLMDLDEFRKMDVFLSEDFGQGRELLYASSSPSPVVWATERSYSLAESEAVGACLGNVSWCSKNTNKALFWGNEGLLPLSGWMFPLRCHNTVSPSSFSSAISLAVVWVAWRWAKLSGASRVTQWVRGVWWHPQPVLSASAHSFLPSCPIRLRSSLFLVRHSSKRPTFGKPS